VRHAGTGRSPGPDFHIDYHDGRVGLGEVSQHADQRVEQMWASVFDQPEPQRIRLAPGLGQWGVRLVAGAKIVDLNKKLPDLIAALDAAGYRSMEVYDGWPRGELADRARRLGVDYLSRASDSEPARAVFFMPSQPGTGAIPSDPNAIVDWVEELLAEPRWATKVGNLLAKPADEHHVFLMSGSLTDSGVEWRLGEVGGCLPTRPPALADGITHLWLLARWGEGPVAMWSAETGWTTVPIGRPTHRATS